MVEVIEEHGAQEERAAIVSWMRKQIVQLEDHLPTCRAGRARLGIERRIQHLGEYIWSIEHKEHLRR